jgi:hypothetical protein
VTQEPFPFAAPVPVYEPADDIDRDLCASGLPFEVRDDAGARLCRHHRRPIRGGRGSPCGECVAAGREEATA